MSSSNKIQIWLLGGFGILSVSMMVYFMFFRKSSSAPAAIKNDKSTDKTAPEGKADKTTENISKPSVSSVQNEVEVEDVDEEEEEEEEADAVSAEQELVKTKYEDANRLAIKYISGQSYEKAVEKLSEALELAPRVSSGSKDMITLYNNRSAMYEKMGTFDKSLSDITVVLTMDAMHLKARVRRARIYEAQGKLKPAMEEYVFAGLIEQMKSEAPSNQHKVEALVKELAQKSAANLYKTLRAASAASDESLLPSKSHCKNFLESYPSMHMWIPHYQTVERAALVSALEEAVGDADLIRQRTLDLVCCDLLHHKFEDAFSLLNTLPVPDASAAPDEAPMSSAQALRYVAPYDEAQRADPIQMLSLQHELIGFNKHLRRDLTGAIDAYNLALRYNPNNIDARMKLSNVYLEVPDLAASMALYDDILSHLEQRSDAQNEVAVVMKAWTLLHRVSNYIVRDDSGVYPAGAIANAQKDVDEALAVADKVKNTVAGKAAMITGLVRSVHVLMQSKPMVGEPAAPEDMERCKTAIASAKALSPTNESVLMLEADILNNEGQSDEGMAIIEALQHRPEAIPGDCTYLCLRASMLVNKAMTALQTGEGMQVAQQIFQDASSLYLQATALEPGAIEVLNQYAQFSSMIGDIPNSVRLLKTAMSLARTRDDVQDLQQLLLVNEAQLKAIETMKAGRA